MIDKDYVFDLTRGIAAYTGDPLTEALAATVADHPEAPFDNAFNHKQVASKCWARDMLAEHTTASFSQVWIMGGWLGVLAAMLFADPRFAISSITSIDIDPSVAPVAERLNAALRASSAFDARTADMYELDYAGPDAPDLVINTSCEHIEDLPGWLALLAPGTGVLLQSNDYASEPTHVNCVASVEEFQTQAGLRKVVFSGALEMPRYTRFMLIGQV